MVSSRTVARVQTPRSRAFRSHGIQVPRVQIPWDSGPARSDPMGFRSRALRPMGFRSRALRSHAAHPCDPSTASLWIRIHSVFATPLVTHASLPHGFPRGSHPLCSCPLCSCPPPCLPPAPPLHRPDPSNVAPPRPAGIRPAGIRPAGIRPAGIPPWIRDCAMSSASSATLTTTTSAAADWNWIPQSLAPAPTQERLV